MIVGDGGGAGQCQFFGVDLGLVWEVGAGLAGLDTRMAREHGGMRPRFCAVGFDLSGLLDHGRQTSCPSSSRALNQPMPTPLFLLTPPVLALLLASKQARGVPLESFASVSAFTQRNVSSRPFFH